MTRVENAGKLEAGKMEAGSVKGKPITLEQIKEAFTERDEMLDEFF